MECIKNNFGRQRPCECELCKNGVASESNVERLVMPNYRELHDNFTEIVAGQLHYFEQVDRVDVNTATIDEIIHLQTGSVERYRNDSIFYAKVTSVVAQLIQAVQKERDERVAGAGGDLSCFKIVKA